MNENARKKREWVKTAAIIFLSVMLVLTFFSNTIMNYSLPEVAVQYVQSGTVTAKIRGSGVVESGDPYNIEVKESRKVASVAVHVGDYVEKGDVILYLEDEESEELKTAQDELEQAWKDYEKLLLSETTTAAGIQAANSNTSTNTYRQQITNAQRAVKEAQKRVDELQEQSNAFATQIALTPSNDADMGDLEEQLNDARTNLENATYAEQAALNNLNALQSDQKMYEEQLAYYKAIVTGDDTGNNTDDNTHTDSGTQSSSPGEGSSAGGQRTIIPTAETGQVTPSGGSQPSAQDNADGTGEGIGQDGTDGSKVMSRSAADQASAPSDESAVNGTDASDEPAVNGTGTSGEPAVNGTGTSGGSAASDGSKTSNAEVPTAPTTPTEPASAEPAPTLSPEEAQKIAEAEKKIEELNKKLEELWYEIQAATDAHNNAVAVKADAQLAYDRAKTAYDNQKASGDTTDTIENLNRQKAAIDADLAKAQSDLKDKQDALTELVGSVTNAYGLQDQMDIITKAQEKVDELTAKSIGATVTADISGTITAINVTAGTTTTAATPVAVMQPEGKGFTMSFSVTNEQAKRLAVGDRAELVNAWRFDDVEVVLASIKPDPDDPGQKKLLTFDVTGAVTAGQTLNISVGQKSANYDYIVPNNSIREDNNGKFILVVTSKSSPLGTRYYATRVDVEVLASDDTQSAVSSGMLTGYDPVITTSTKPVEAGKLVRLAEN